MKRWWPASPTFARTRRSTSTREANHQTDVIGDTAVATFTYEMVYENSGKCEPRHGPRPVGLRPPRERMDRRLANYARPRRTTRLNRISSGTPAMCMLAFAYATAIMMQKWPTAER